jgi:multidrug efflux system membrane fusion protein
MTVRTTEETLHRLKTGVLHAVLLTIILGLIAGTFSACSEDASGTRNAENAQKREAVPVTVGDVVQRTVPVQLRAIGNVEPYATVSVNAQVEGELTSVHFKEGQEMKEGDLLFTIDSRFCEVQLKEAEGNLAKDRAKLENAKKQVERYASVVGQGYVAEEQYDQVVADAAALEGTVKADEAAVEKTKLELSYCTIKSPINGVTGSLGVNRGNIIKAIDKDRPLVVINQIRPVYVTFAIAERYLPELKKYMAERKLEVTAAIQGDQHERVLGELTFVQNKVDKDTGTIQLKATFPNEDRALWPGQFVNVLLTLRSDSDAIVVPSQAIQTGQQGEYVFVVKPDMTVDHRIVEVERAVGDETVIRSGVSAGEKVVTDGQLKLASGSLVKIVDAASQ